MNNEVLIEKRSQVDLGRNPSMLDDEIVVAKYIATDLRAPDIGSFRWKRSHPVQIHRYWSGEIAPEARHASARILWSKKALYVRFVCHQREPLIVNPDPQTEKKTKGLWDRDVCEIFIAPDPNQVNRYFEFEAAPTGEWLDVAVNWSAERRDSDWDFASEMTSEAHVVEGWTMISMRIPWNQWIPEPQKGDRWRVNLFRCVGKDPNRGYLAWQPTRLPEPGFHLPQVFGWLLFE